MKKTNALRTNKEFKRIIRVLKNSNLTWLIEADDIEVISLNRGKLKIIFYWEGGEILGKEYAPSRSECICLIQKDRLKIKEIRSTTDKLWIFDKRGRLLFESPSEEKQIRRRPCRK